MQDVLLAAALRAFEDTTAGAAVVAANNYCSLGFISMSHVPSYNTLLREFARPSYMPLLYRLIKGSAGPLIGLEAKFAVDSTGYATGTYSSHNNEKHGTQQQRPQHTPKHRWVKGHFVYGTTTGIVAAAQITEPDVPDCPLMPALLQRVEENGGRVSEWLADAAYMSYYNTGSNGGRS